MNAILYQNSSDRRTVNKALRQVGTATYDYKGACNILNPIIIVKDWNAACNYVYITDLGRYYYVTDFTINGLVATVTLEIDVLKTYAAQIQSMRCLVDRQEYEVAEDIVDGAIETDCTIELENSLIGQCGDSAYHYYLSTVGL